MHQVEVFVVLLVIGLWDNIDQSIQVFVLLEYSGIHPWAGVAFLSGRKATRHETLRWSQVAEKDQVADNDKYDNVRQKC